VAKPYEEVSNILRTREVICNTTIGFDVIGLSIDEDVWNTSAFQFSRQ
jgi:hypothetical protein